MIDYDKEDDDPVVAEVRRAREALGAKFNFDLDLIFAEMKRRESTNGRKYSKRKPVTPHVPPTKKVG